MGKRKKSWSSNGDEAAEDCFSSNKFFFEGLLAQPGSPEARQHGKIANALWDVLEDVQQLDARQRTLIWSDAERLDLKQSIQRIRKQCPDIPQERIEDFMLFWLKVGYDPGHYSQDQLDELNELIGRWVADYDRQLKTSKNDARTRHS
jgi:hypothetical protein